MTPPYGSAAAARTAPRPARAPRRVSGPVAVPRRSPPRPRTRGARALDALLRLPDHRLLDRALRGRAWIAVLAVALMGIVAMQVSMLRMNAGIGRSVQQASTLERQNSALRAELSGLSSGDRIAARAQQLGYEMAPAGQVRYVSPRPGDAARAARRAAGTATATGTTPQG